jgi:hypothetical protein
MQDAKGMRWTAALTELILGRFLRVSAGSGAAMTPVCFGSVSKVIASQAHYETSPDHEQIVGSSSDFT